LVDQEGTEAPVVAAEDVAALEAVEASYQLWLTNGMTEKVASWGQRYVLTYQPNAQGGAFLAGLCNLEIDDIIPIEQPERFTGYSA